MATVREEKRIVITTNPTELRDLADKMEREFPKKQVGDSTAIAVLACSEGSTVIIHADQEWFAKLED